MANTSIGNRDQKVEGESMRKSKRREEKIAWVQVDII